MKKKLYFCFSVFWRKGDALFVQTADNVRECPHAYVFQSRPKTEEVGGKDVGVDFLAHWVM